jgi:hypothetical protein
MALLGKKLGWGAILEGLALGIFCAGLGYVSCREATPTAPREKKVLAADRPGAEPDGASARRRDIELALHDVLLRVATGALPEEQRAETQNQLTALLERHAWGKPEGRAAAAAMIVQQVFDQAKMQTVTASLSSTQRQAMTGLAKELTRQLMLVATGGAPGADALDAKLPEGHSRVNWKRLGGFEYVEGGEVPPDLKALDRTKVGLPGFMLTLGDTQNIREFVLVESLWGCCFGTVPAVNQTLLVRLAPIGAVEYTAAPIVVTGVMEVGEERQGGFVTSLYRIVDAKVRLLDAESP